MREQWEKIIGYGKKMKKDQLLILLLAGILLFVISLPVNPTKKTTSKQSVQESSAGTDTESQNRLAAQMDYAAELEEKLRKTLIQVAGVGDAKVMLTLESSVETVVEKDVPNTRNTSSEADSTGGTRTSMDITSSEATVYMTDETGRQTPYVVKEIEPMIKGVVIVAAGGNDPMVVSAITEATQALFQIEPHKIKVMKMKNKN